MTSLTARLNSTSWVITQVKTISKRVLGVLWDTTSFVLLRVGEDGIESYRSNCDKEIVDVDEPSHAKELGVSSAHHNQGATGLYLVANKAHQQEREAHMA